MAHVVFAETGMPFSRLIGTDEGHMVHVRRTGLSHDEDSLKPLARAYETAPKMPKNLLARKRTAQHLVERATVALGHWKTGV